jgi:phosphate starvation-inducible protein PhoH and related proteins
MTRLVSEPEPRATAADVKVTSDVEIDDTTVLMGLTGPRGDRLKAIERELSIECGLRGNTIFLRGRAESVALAERFFAEAAELFRQGVQIDANDVGRALRMLQSDSRVNLRDMFDDVVTLGLGRRPVGPRGLAQKRYVESIRSHDLTSASARRAPARPTSRWRWRGGAHENQVTRMVLCRPAVEAGEKLGFLPGDLAEKVNPYLRPLYDALHDMVDFDRARRMLERGTIEVAPLAFMRGRTLNDSSSSSTRRRTRPPSR